MNTLAVSISLNTSERACHLLSLLYRDLMKLRPISLLTHKRNLHHCLSCPPSIILINGPFQSSLTPQANRSRLACLVSAKCPLRRPTPSTSKTSKTNMLPAISHLNSRDHLSQPDKPPWHQSTAWITTSSSVRKPRYIPHPAPPLTSSRAAQGRNPRPVPNHGPSLDLRHHRPPQPRRPLQRNVTCPGCPYPPPPLPQENAQSDSVQENPLGKPTSPPRNDVGQRVAAVRPARTARVRRERPQPGHLHARVRGARAPREPAHARQDARLRGVQGRAGARDGDGDARAQARRGAGCARDGRPAAV